ncbi:hypothetical protein Cadr_000014386 [Camelus dromedarius]|uniref:Uncharacterized protein n=1 Tax=Camelus dromedarius TaxID=9838 RepID=A0A5N4DM97_CAMDR|nr:hypothetical protein Cadr_000014386 [Camelus dromedarius]
MPLPEPTDPNLLDEGPSSGWTYWVLAQVHSSCFYSFWELPRASFLEGDSLGGNSSGNSLPTPVTGSSIVDVGIWKEEGMGSKLRGDTWHCTSSDRGLFLASGPHGEQDGNDPQISTVTLPGPRFLHSQWALRIPTGRSLCQGRQVPGLWAGPSSPGPPSSRAPPGTPTQGLSSGYFFCCWLLPWSQSLPFPLPWPQDWSTQRWLAQAECSLFVLKLPDATAGMAARQVSTSAWYCAADRLPVGLWDVLFRVRGEEVRVPSVVVGWKHLADLLGGSGYTQRQLFLPPLPSPHQLIMGILNSTGGWFCEWGPHSV